MDFRVPEIGEGVYEAEFVAWMVKVGDKVKRGQNLMEVMTDKAAMEVPSPFAGTITGLRAEPGQQIKVGDVVLTYDGTGQSAEKETPVAAARYEPKMESAKTKSITSEATVSDGHSAQRKRNGASVPTEKPGLVVKAAPSVRYLARKMGIDLNRIQGSGPQGRILLDDLSHVLAAPETSSRDSEPAEPRPDYGKPGTRIKLQGVRRKIAEHMAHAKRTIPHYSYIDEYDVTALVALRESLREPCNRLGVKLTY